MSSYHEKPASIYCAVAQVHSKKPSRAGLQNIKGMGMCVRYRCERDSEATIIKEAFIKPLEYDKSAHTNTGETIEGKTIDVYINDLKSIDTGKTGGHTGRHSTQSFRTHALTYATLIQPFVHIENAVAKRKQVESSIVKEIGAKAKMLQNK